MTTGQRRKLLQSKRPYRYLNEVADEFVCGVPDLLYSAKKGELELCAEINQIRPQDNFCFIVPDWLVNLLPSKSLQDQDGLRTIGNRNFIFEMCADIGTLTLKGNRNHAYFESGSFLLALKKENIPPSPEAFAFEDDYPKDFKLPEHYEINLKIQYKDKGNLVCMTIPINHEFNPVGEEYNHLKKDFSHKELYPFEIYQLPTNSLRITAKEKERFKEWLGQDEEKTPDDVLKSIFFEANGILYSELKKSLKEEELPTYLGISRSQMYSAIPPRSRSKTISEKTLRNVHNTLLNGLAKKSQRNKNDIREELLAEKLPGYKNIPNIHRI